MRNIGVLARGALDGKLTAGTWTLEITDNKRGKTGTLDSWSLRVAGLTRRKLLFDFLSRQQQRAKGILKPRCALPNAIQPPLSPTASQCPRPGAAVAARCRFDGIAVPSANPLSAFARLAPG